MCQQIILVKHTKSLDNYKLYVYNSKAIRGVAQFGSIESEVRPVDDEARAKWRSGQNRSALQAEKRFWEPQEGGCRRFKFSAAASVGASVLRTEVSTGHPRPVDSTMD